MPIKNGVLWQRHSGNEKAIYIVEATGEKFATKEEMNDRIRDYAERTWRSRHEVCSGPDRIFSNALEEEVKVLEAFRKRLPEAVIADICKQIHHSFLSKEMLARSICSKLKKKFCKGESVRISHFGKEWEGTVIEISQGSGTNSSPSDKENAVKYTIELSNDDGKVIRGIDATKICRKEPLSEEDVMSLILLVAFKKSGGNTAWTLDEPIRKEFGVANKIHSMFLGVKSPPTGKSPEFVDISSDDSEVEIIVPRRSAGIAPNSAIAKKQQAEFAKQQRVKEMLHKKKEAAKKKEQKAKEKVKKDSKLSQTELKKKSKTKEGTSAEELLKKKAGPLGGPVKVHQENLTKFLVTTPGTSSPGFSSLAPKRIGEMKVESTCARLTKELVSHNKLGFQNACAVAAKSLSLPLIESIPNELLRFAVRRQYDQSKDVEAMKNMTAEQKKKYRENVKRERRDGKMLTKLQRALNKKLDDTLLADAKPLPTLTPIYDPLDERAKIFPSCLSISEFVYISRLHLHPRHIPAAEELVEAVLSGRKGFFECVGHVIVSLLKALVQDNSKKVCYAYGTRLSALPITLGTATYLTRIFMAGGSKQLCEEEEELAAVNSGEVETSEEVMERDTETPDSIFRFNESRENYDLVEMLSTKEVFELPAQRQLEIMEYLIDQVRNTVGYDDHFFESMKEGIRSAKRSKAKLSSEMDELRKQIEGIVLPDAKALEDMKRREAIEVAIKAKRRSNLEERLRAKEEKAIEIDQKITELEKMSLAVVRLKPLGFDRSHRRYWFFEGSPNKGIFVEKGWWRSGSTTVSDEGNDDAEVKVEVANAESPDKSKNKKNSMTLDDFLSSGLTYPDEREASEWYRINDVATFDKFLSTLAENGYRESKLLSNLKANREDICKSLSKLSDDASKTKVKCDDEQPSDELSSLREEILSFESRLQASLFTNISEDLFTTKVNTAESVGVLSELLVELADSLSDRAVKRTAFSLDGWKKSVLQRGTVSRLNVLLNVLELHIDWRNSLKRLQTTQSRKNERKRKLISKLNGYSNLSKQKYYSKFSIVTDADTYHSDSDGYDIKPDVEEYFARLEKDARTYNALITVPPVRAYSYSEPISLESLRKNLHLYSTIRSLRADMEIFINGALNFFEGNERKISQLEELKERLDL